MPVDRKLAISSLKRLDEELYNMYKKFEDLDDYVRKDPESYKKLQIYMLSLDALDHLEDMGAIEIINDYEKNAVYVKRNVHSGNKGNSIPQQE